MFTKYNLAVATLQLANLVEEKVEGKKYLIITLDLLTLGFMDNKIKYFMKIINIY